MIADLIDLFMAIAPYNLVCRGYMPLRSEIAGDRPWSQCLHAKCVVVDEQYLFVTSANFTEAANDRNIEAGLLVNDRGLAKALRSQFEQLVAQRILERVPGLS